MPPSRPLPLTPRRNKKAAATAGMSGKKVYLCSVKLAKAGGCRNNARDYAGIWIDKEWMQKG